jgi:uncharacterized protein (DUF1015 family)
MKLKPFQAVYADTSMIASPQSFYDTVKEEYQDYKRNDFFKKWDKQGFYLYEIVRPERAHLGLIACADIKDFEKGKILKHEQTLAEKEQKMMNLMLQRKAMIKPVLLTYPRHDALKQLLYNIRDQESPFHEVFFDLQAETHRIWAIDDPQNIQFISAVFEKDIPFSYIADGHHRCSTTLYIHNSFKKKKKKELHFDRLLSVFFDFEELTVFDYNRIVDAFEDISPTEFMARLSTRFDIEVLATPSKPHAAHEIALCIGKEWYLLHWKPEVLSKYETNAVVLDADLLNIEVFQNILGIADVRTDSRIDYVEGIKDLDFFQHKVQKRPSCAGFCLFPVALADVCKVADAGLTMPPKSTWFEPRIKNGMTIYEL